MRIVAALIVLLLSVAGVAAQSTSSQLPEWQDYVSLKDGFSINLPGQPRISEIAWQSQFELRAPGWRIVQR